MIHKKPNIKALQRVHDKKLDNHPDIGEMRKILGSIRSEEKITLKHIPHLQKLVGNLAQKEFYESAIEVAEIALWKVRKENPEVRSNMDLIDAADTLGDTHAVAGGRGNYELALEQYKEALNSIRAKENGLGLNDKMRLVIESYSILLSAKIAEANAVLKELQK